MIQLPTGVTIIPMNQLIKDHMLTTLAYFKGDVTKAAKALGLARSTMYNRLKYMKLHRNVDYR
jgi:transcriptional regulator of acetoin/glycerol metabolism